MRFSLRWVSAFCAALVLALQVVPSTALAAAGSVGSIQTGNSFNAGTLGVANSVTLELDLLNANTAPVETTLKVHCGFGSGQSTDSTSVTFNVGPSQAGTQMVAIQWSAELAKVAGQTLACRADSFGDAKGTKGCVVGHTADLTIPKGDKATDNEAFLGFTNNPIQLSLQSCPAPATPAAPAAPATVMTIKSGDGQSLPRVFTPMVPVGGGIAVFQPLIVNVQNNGKPMAFATVTFTCGGLPSDYKCQFTQYGTDNGVWKAVTDAFGNAKIPATMWVWKPSNPAVTGSHEFTVTVTGPDGSSVTFNETVTT